MVVGAGRYLAGMLLSTGLLVAAQSARGESPLPLRSIEADAFLDRPEGVKYGSLLFHSYLLSGHIWDSNIFLSKDHIIADRILFVRPGLSVSTLDPNYRFTIRSSLHHLEYDVSPSESRTDARVEMNGTIRAQRDREIDVGSTAARVSEPRSIQRRDLPDNAAEPIVHNMYSAWIALRQMYNPLTSTTTVRVENDNYFNVRSNSGSIINLQNLDRDILRVNQDFDLRLSHRLSLFSQQRLIESTYRNEPGFIQRDSVKYETVNGIELAFTPLIRGRFSFQFGEEHFWADAINAEPERTYAAQLTWSPRRNIRIGSSFSRDFGGISFDLDRTGGRRTRTDVTLDYEITQRLFLRSGFAYLHANETGILTGGGRIEDSYLYKVALGYELARYWTLFVDYSYERRDANPDISSFERQIIQTGVMARF